VFQDPGKMFAAAPPPPLQQRKLDIPGPVVTIKSELSSALESHLGGLPPTKRLRHESTNEMWDDYSQGSGTFFNSSSPQDDTGSLDDDDQFSPKDVIGKYRIYLYTILYTSFCLQE
jgi:hypothetical protein